MKPIQTILNLIYPPKCPFCGRVLERGEVDLCFRCQRSLPWTEGQNATVDFCDVSLSPLKYRDGVRHAVHRYKFNYGRMHSKFLGTLMAQCLHDRWSEQVDAVVWVPLSKKHRRRRGYDQAELLARAACRRWDAEPVRLLRKTVNNPAQSGLADAAAASGDKDGFSCQETHIRSPFSIRTDIASMHLFVVISTFRLYHPPMLK